MAEVQETSEFTHQAPIGFHPLPASKFPDLSDMFILIDPHL